MIQLKETSASACPFCKAPFDDVKEIVRCFLCKTSHHLVCWKEHNNQCSIFLCNGTQTIAPNTGISDLISVTVFYSLFNIIAYFFVTNLHPYLSIPDSIALFGVPVGLLFVAFILLARLRQSWDSFHDTKYKPLLFIQILILLSLISANAYFLLVQFRR